MVYLDNSATTRPCAEAVLAAQQALTAAWGNPSSIHRSGLAARAALEDARAAVAAARGAEK